MIDISCMLDDIRLYYRYGCRRLGLPSYQIHQIYLPAQKLIYIPISKNACTSIKQALHKIEFDCLFDVHQPQFSDYKEIHDYYQKRRHAFTSVGALKTHVKVTRFALIRDPVKRLISCYRNRVVDLGDLAGNKKALQSMNLPSKPDVNTFVLHLEKYRKANKSIEHHSRAQFHFLGGDIQYLDCIFTMHDIAKLISFLRRYESDLTLLKRKSGGTKISLKDLSRRALQKAIQFYKKDYELLHDYFTQAAILNEYKASLKDA